MKKNTYGPLVKILCFFIFVLAARPLFAHVVVGELENLSKTDAALLYLKTGYTHILPLGLDHILFVLSLFLLSPKLKPVLWQATAFTIAHSVTLGLAMYHIISPAPQIIEPVIALSILYVALENIFSPKLKSSRIGIVFLFGLVHGMGFASALGQIGLPQNAYLSSLVMFNLGVELGQITVILAAFFLFGIWFGKKAFYRNLIVVPLSVLIAVTALYWTVERVYSSFSLAKTEPAIIVSVSYADSLTTHYSPPLSINQNATEMTFWKNRIDPSNPGFTNEIKYASTLAARFPITGDISDLLASDSVLKNIDIVFGHKEVAPLLSMTAHAISLHRFTDADSMLEDAKTIGLKNYESLTASFDIDFEMGRYLSAERELKRMASPNDYGYYFRLAKLDHYKGQTDTAIAAMLKAAELAGNDPGLKQSALSNAADLYLHNAKPQKAYELYKTCISLNPADMHSITGLGWIALLHDKNTALAEKLFQFVKERTKSGDPLYKLTQAALASNDSVTAVKYAHDFESVTTDQQHGNMYNRYLIDLYTGILNDPDKATSIAVRELLNRKTPQTFAWLAWTLYCNGKKADAYKLYLDKVSGKPLEGPELYWMGRMMKGLGKDFISEEFFKAAWNNRYDLGPEKFKELSGHY